MNKAKQGWEAPQAKTIKSVDVSRVVYKLEAKKNPYLRPPSYRRQKSISLFGTNSECY